MMIPGLSDKNEVKKKRQDITRMARTYCYDNNLPFNSIWDQLYYILKQQTNVDIIHIYNNRTKKSRTKLDIVEMKGLMNKLHEITERYVQWKKKS